MADYALGVILMIAGAVWFVVALATHQQRRRYKLAEHRYHEGP